MIRHSSTALSCLLGMFIFWAPLPFGSVSSGFRVLLWALLVTILLFGLSVGSASRSWKKSGAVVLCLLGVSGLALLQTAPLPAGLVRLISPAHLELAESVSQIPDLQVSGSASGARGDESGLEVVHPKPKMTFSVSSSRRAAVAWLMVAIAVFLGSLVQSRKEVRIVLAAVVLAAVFQAVYGGPRLLGGDDLIWGSRMPTAQGRFRGTFVNPNHAAFFMGLALPIVTAWIWLSTLRLRTEDRTRFQILELGIAALVWMLLAGGLILTQSRAGALVALLVVLLQGVLMFWRRPGLVLAIVPAGAAVLLLTFSGWLSAGLAERLWEARVAASTSGARGMVYRAVWDLWQEFPFIGAGMGSFRSVFSARAPSEISGSWWNAHSDWLELLLTGGLLGAGLVIAALVLWVRSPLRRLQSVSRERRAVAIAVLGAATAASLHSLVDFGLAMPANALVFAVIAGVGVAPSGRRKARRSRS